MRVALSAGALVAGLLWVQSAVAATITTAIDFVASDFTSTSGNVPAPISPVSGSFTLTFDPSLSYSDQSAGLVLNHIDIAVSGVPLFSYDPRFGAVIGISMDSVGSSGAAWGTNDFLLSIITSARPLATAGFGYTQDGIVNFFSAHTVVVTMNPPVPQVPVPGSLLLLLTGLVGMGGLGLWRASS